MIAREFDSIFVIISSHGLNNEVHLAGEPNEFICVVEDVMQQFSDDNFPQYEGKPKVFMPITCQNFGRWSPTKDLGPKGYQLYDMLVCYPVLPGFRQKRYSGKGSLFVNWLVYNFMKYATSSDLVTILTMVRQWSRLARQISMPLTIRQVQQSLKEQVKRTGLNLTVNCHSEYAFRPFFLVQEQEAVDSNDNNGVQEQEAVDTNGNNGTDNGNARE